MSALTAADYDSVDRALRELHGRGCPEAFSLNELFDAWAGLVAEVEQGYDENVYEYTSDLRCRDWLALAWPMLTDRVRDARADALDGLDARFRAATVHDDGLVVERFRCGQDEDSWWWRRRPLIPQVCPQ